MATVAIGNAANAGLLALRILATSQPQLQESLLKYQVHTRVPTWLGGHARHGCDAHDSKPEDAVHSAHSPGAAARPRCAEVVPVRTP